LADCLDFESEAHVPTSYGSLLNVNNKSFPIYNLNQTYFVAVWVKTSAQQLKNSQWNTVFEKHALWVT